MLENKKIGIIGLGLIGGSIEKCLQNLKTQIEFEIKSVSRSQNKNYKIEDLLDCHIIFLCSPQSAMLKQLEEIALLRTKAKSEGQDILKNTVITDVASTKSLITKKATELGLDDIFIPGHPMAGTEKYGYANSFPEMFQSCKWILGIKDERTKLLEYLILEVFKANSIDIMDEETHDKAVALSSHLPLVLSSGLGLALNTNRNAVKTIGPGFKGMARLGRGNYNLSQEIIAYNKENIKELWEEYKNEIDRFLASPNSLLMDDIKIAKKSLDNVC